MTPVRSVKVDAYRISVLTMRLFDSSGSSRATTRLKSGLEGLEEAAVR